MTGKVITVSRQVGSDGEEVARMLAEKIWAPFLDREIISRAAALAGVSEETVQEAERAQSFLDRMVELLGRYPVAAELGAPMPDLPATPALTVDTYRKLIEDVIHSVAEKGPAVILGHGGQMVLRDNPDVLRVFVCAPLERRIAYMMTREGLTAAAPRSASRKKTAVSPTTSAIIAPTERPPHQRPDHKLRSHIRARRGLF